ncbi:hypothetical protein L195_g063935, partial [Trifolium pratense]
VHFCHLHSCVDTSIVALTIFILASPVNETRNNGRKQSFKRCYF